ncbi:helix-turn-helix domain-containing protein [Providencia vermicola]|uniref:helix-turn-helix domain-containing protein n=1 Tax=Providencia vermicola TaxID=333965 RepID=UPI002AB55A00|nr:helix-turn-helix transcriptional regulator [Providencia stuartii]
MKKSHGITSISPSQIVGRRIRKIRSQKGFTGTTLGQQLQLSQQHVSRIENGTTRLNVEQLQLFSKVLNVDLADLLDGIGFQAKQLYSPFSCGTWSQAHSLILDHHS